MLKSILTTCALFLFSLIYSQKSEILKEFTDAEGFISLSEKRVNYAFDYIRKAKNEESFEMMKDYSKKSKNEAEYCKKQTQYASDEIFDIQGKLRDLSCSEAITKSDELELLLNDAKSIFDDAFNEFRKAEYADTKDDLESFLQTGKKYLNESLSKLKTIKEQITFAKESINNCY